MVDAYFQPFENELDELSLPLMEREGISHATDSALSMKPGMETLNLGSTEPDLDILNWAMSVGGGSGSGSGGSGRNQQSSRNNRRNR